MKPQISVVMPAYNAESFLGEAVASIIQQSYNNFELIIVDDGSTDSTPAIMKSIRDSRVKTLKQPTNQGFISAICAGINEAQGEWIARMDADDISHPNRLKSQMEFLTAHPECVFVGTAYHFISPAGKFVARSPLGEGWRYVTKEILTLGQQIFADPSVIFHRKTALQVGLYDDDLPYEIPLWYKLLLKGEGAELLEPLHFYRVTINSLSRKPRKLDHRSISLATRERYDPENAKTHLLNDPDKWPNIRQTRLANLMQAIRLCNITKDRKIALKIFSTAIKEYPIEIRVWKLLLKSLLGIENFSFWKKIPSERHEEEIIPPWKNHLGDGKP